MADPSFEVQAKQLENEKASLRQELQLANLMLADLSMQLAQAKVSGARDSALLKLANQPTA